jgi:uncharacterized protein YegL
MKYVYFEDARFIISSGVILLALLLSGCGGGSSSTPEATPTATGSTVVANYTKGPVTGATALLIDENGQTVAGPVTTVDGSASFNNVTYTGLVYAQLTGGSYTDEATGATVNLSNSFQIRSGVISSGNAGTLQLTATPLTEIGFQRAESAGGGSVSLSSVNSFIEEVADEYGLDNINLTTVAPTPITQITGTSESDRYGTVLAAITQQQMNDGQSPSETALDTYITTSVSNVDTSSFNTAVNDLNSNSNTSSFITTTLTNQVTNQVGQSTVTTYSIGLTISGLSGSITLQNNQSDDLIVSSDGGYTFSSSLQDGSTYNITVSHQPSGQTCSVSNGSGTTTAANASNISVICQVTSRNYVFEEFYTNAALPSVITSLFRVRNKQTNEPIVGLTSSDFITLENSVEITPFESFKDLEPITQIPSTFYTVLALDISSSISAVNLQIMKDTAKAIIEDPTTGASRVRPGQQIAIYTFESTVVRKSGFSNDISSLLQAIDNIGRGGPSTNLYGAIVQGMDDWTDRANVNNIEYGAMILVTDGDDTAEEYTFQNALDAVAGKIIFSIPVGNNANISNLETLSGASNVIPVSNFTGLSSAIDQAIQQANSYIDGLYYLYYATPKRSNSHTLEIKIAGNQNTDPDGVIVSSFSANNFYNVSPEVTLYGDNIFNMSDSTTWQVRTKWSNDLDNYQWTLTDVNNLLTMIPGQNDSSSALITSVGNTLPGIASIEITDLNWPNFSSAQATFDVLVTDVSANDSDGDGVDNNNDPFPHDPWEKEDLDMDGIGDYGDRYVNFLPTTPSIRISGTSVVFDTYSTDADNDHITYTYSWGGNCASTGGLTCFIARIECIGLTQQSLPFGCPRAGDTWTVNVRAFDGKEYSPAASDTTAY